MTPARPQGGGAAKVVVAGHLCLDLIPSFGKHGARLEPGQLVEVGPATIACGGGVANVGQALLKLGVEARLIGKIGEDAFGDLLATLLGPRAAQGLKRASGESTSYTVVINPPGLDRTFLHHAGCNATFGPEAISLAAVAEADAFYFGYPPLLRRIYEDGGVGFAELLEKVKKLGLTTVLDMAMPDPETAAGRSDWRAFLARVLPQVDFFMPSLEEVCFMLGKPAPNGTTSLAPIAERLLEQGTRAVGLKLGEDGLYLRTAKLGAAGLGRAAPRDLTAWTERELWSPVFQAQVKGTTGAGDATIAGFITGLLKGETPEGCLMLANAVGASSVEALDAVSGVGSVQEVTERLARGWPRRAHEVDDGYWRAGPHGVYHGRHDWGGRA